MIRWLVGAQAVKSGDFNGEYNQWLVIHWLGLPTRCSTDEYCSWLIDLWYWLLRTAAPEWLMSEQYFELAAFHPDIWRPEIETEHTHRDNAYVWNCSVVFQYAVIRFYWPGKKVTAVWRHIAFHRNSNFPFSVTTELRTCNLDGARMVYDHTRLDSFCGKWNENRDLEIFCRNVLKNSDRLLCSRTDCYALELRHRNMFQNNAIEMWLGNILQKMTKKYSIEMWLRNMPQVNDKEICSRNVTW
jgi:hypothetical protein